MINFTINLNSWAWPQITYVVLSAFAIIVSACKHGEPKAIPTISVGETLFNAFIAFFLLTIGGFFA